MNDRTPVCVVELGHPNDTLAEWRCTLNGLKVCSHHRRQYDQRPDLGPYQWERL